MNESEFHRLADSWFTMASDVLEAADADGALDMESHNDSLTLVFPGGKTIVISKHTASRQIWFASPLSGGLHFSYNGGRWALADGRTLETVISKELDAIAGLTIVWP